MSSDIRIRKGTPLLIALLIFALVVFRLSAQAYVARESDLRWGADTLDYLDYYLAAGLDYQLFSLGQNLFGPLVILTLTRANALAVLFLNMAALAGAYAILTRNIGLRSAALMALLWLNPMVLVSVLAVNKEIIALFATAAYAAYLVGGRLKFLTLALLAALFVRWQNVLVIVLFELLRSRLNPFREYRLLSVVLVVLLVSAVYPFFDVQLGGVITEEVREQQAGTSFGLLDVANDIQRNFGYIIVLLPKVLANWFGNLPRVARLFYDLESFDLSDIYNTFVIPGHQLAMVVVCVMLLLKRRATLRSDLVYFGVVYSIIYALSMFIQYRYLFPVYVLFAVELVRHDANSIARRALPSGDEGMRRGTGASLEDSKPA